MVDLDYTDLNLSYDKITIVPVSNIWILIATKDEELMDGIRNHFTFKVPNAHFSSQYKSGNWDGKIRLMKTNGLLARGLLSEVIELAKKWDVKVDLFDDELKAPLNDISDVREIIHSELISKTGKEPWDHQWQVVEEVIKHKRCIARSATSSGKSYMQAMTIKYLHTKEYVNRTLLIVPKLDLTIQMERDFLEYGMSKEDIGLYMGKIKDENKNILISTWQSLQNIEDPEWFEQFDLVISDECFTGDTRVNTRDGYKMIKDICKGDMIWSYNEKTNSNELKEVEHVYENRTNSNKLIIIELENGNEIKCTPNHLINTERGWIKACELTNEDEIFGLCNEDNSRFL